MISLPSFDFIPEWLYMPLFHWVIFALVSFSMLRAADGSVYDWNAARGTRLFFFWYVIILILYIGLRPAYEVFADSTVYASSVEGMQRQGWAHWLDSEPYLKNEWLFACLEAFSAFYADAQFEFLICACIYVGCCVKFCTRTFGQHWVLPFLMFCASFSFFTDGVNIIRNGMAASLTILALSYRNTKWLAILLCFLALGIHKSMILMMLAALISWKITNSKYYISAWVASIIFVLIFGSSIGDWVGNSGILNDKRMNTYLIRDESRNLYYTGFRTDFLLYSALPIITGGYFIYRKKYQDTFYVWIYNIYITCNAAWVVLMYAAFSDRIAHISWFLMPFILIYPWFRKIHFQRQSQQLCKFLMLCYAYTFYANILIPTFFRD